MIVLRGLTVNKTYPAVLRMLAERGVDDESRNGPVVVAPDVVTVETEWPNARVLFDDARDANPFFHLCEAVWMLAGRNDVAFPARFVSRMNSYSDDGFTLAGAYGRRWRDWEIDHETGEDYSIDQIYQVVRILKGQPSTRRAVLAFWNPAIDLRGALDGSLDVPCNLTATFQATTGWKDRWRQPRIDMTVFQRSGDAIWGVTGANAVHLSLMHELVAAAAGGWQGTMRQVVVNLHAYKDVMVPLLRRSPHLSPERSDRFFGDAYDPYSDSSRQRPVVRPLFSHADLSTVDALAAFTSDARAFCDYEAAAFGGRRWLGWFREVALPMRDAWFAYKDARHKGAETNEAAAVAIREIETMDPQLDWCLAARGWLRRRIYGREQPA